jgi:hypothetical protein
VVCRSCVDLPDVRSVAAMWHGAAQDLAELDIDLAAITQAGGWKSTRMPLQYAEKINAARSGMARAGPPPAATKRSLNRGSLSLWPRYSRVRFFGVLLQS